MIDRMNEQTALDAANAIRSIETRSLPTFGIRSRIVSVNEFAPFGV